MINSKCLVTGATGFIGRALCEELARRGRGVVAAVRDVERAGTLSVQMVQVPDVVTYNDWSTFFQGVEVVVHLAARVHVMRDSASDPLAAFRALNVMATERLARAAAAHGVKRFVYMSSIKVNGEGTLPNHPFSPGDVPSPMDPYGVSKYEAELALRKVAKETNIEVVIIRPTLVYGPGVKANFLSMIRSVYRGFPLPLGAINNSRSFVAVDNLVDLVITCLHHPSASNQTFLVSDGQDVSTPELLRKLSAALGRPARLVSIPPWLLRTTARLIGKGDFAERLCGSLQVDISKTRALLDWNPPVKLDTALKKTAESFLAEELISNRNDGLNK